MPSTMTKRISRSWTNRNNSLVDTPSRLAASVARSASLGTGVPFVIKVEFTAEISDLALNIDDEGETARLDQGVSCVLEVSQQ
jgi:hypothetical protein